ncbi:MAG: HXXEE domain-containing protein [Pseudomonadota bacterium]
MQVTNNASRLAQLALLLAFMAMLWAPLGQLEFLAFHWMKIGTYMAPIVVFLAFKFRERSSGPMFEDVTFMAMLFAAAYFIHQYEEHWINLLGETYPLLHELNSLIAAVLGEDKYGIMTREAIFYINTGTVWATALVAIWASPRLVFPSMAMAGIMAMNGFAHVMVALRTFSYNSGLLTGLVIFLPLVIVYFRALSKSGKATRSMIIAAIGWGVLGHVVLFGGLFLANVMAVIPVSLYYGVLIGLGFAPLVLYRHAGAGHD